MSVPFFAREFVFVQPDGNPVAVQGFGNQQCARFRSLDGTPVVRDPNTGFFRPASRARGDSVGEEADALNSTATPLPKPRWRSRHELQRDLLREEGASDGMLRAPPARRTVGDFTGLCLPITFPDVPATVSHEDIEAFCNQPGYAGFGNNGSVFDYFHDVSAGRLNYRTLVAPAYNAIRPRGHYTDPGVPFGQRARELIAEALSFHRTRGFDVSSLTIDAQRGVYAMNVLYAGDVVNAWSEGLWPHASRLEQPITLAPGKSAVDYQISATGSALSLGVYCHENGHMLCDFPDLYQYDDSRRGVGRYCLMCLGPYNTAQNPTHVGAYLKHRAGWGDAVPLTPGRHSLSTLEPNRFYIHARTTDKTEYFLIEGRRNTGRDAGLSSTGLAIWHIDELGSNTHPADGPAGHQHYECTLLQADGLDELRLGEDSGDSQDLFGTAEGPAFGEGSPISGTWWDGTPSGLRIHSVEASGSELGFTAEIVA